MGNADNANNMMNNPQFGEITPRRYVPLLVWTLVALALLLIPLKIISYGYMPNDDALRHAAKAVSGKPWSEILVLRAGYTVDHNFGWHALLRQLHLATGSDTEGLVIFSIVGLFTLLGWSALPWLKRPEAWLGTLILVAGTVSGYMARYTLGRPFLLSMAILLTILFLWQVRGNSSPSWRNLTVDRAHRSCGVDPRRLVFVGLAGGGVFSGPPISLGIGADDQLAGRNLYRGGLHGTPVSYLSEALRIALNALSRHPIQFPLVTEFQPTPGNLFGLLLIGGLLVFRQLAKLDPAPLEH